MDRNTGAHHSQKAHAKATDPSVRNVQKPEAESTLRLLLSLLPLILVATTSWFVAGWIIDQTKLPPSSANATSGASSSDLTPSLTPEPTTVSGLKPFPMAVANTSGQGVAISRTPSNSDRIKVWPERTIMMIIAPDREVDGQKWSNVRDPDGTEGWVPAEFLVIPSSLPPSS